MVMPVFKIEHKMAILAPRDLSIFARKCTTHVETAQLTFVTPVPGVRSTNEQDQILAKSTIFPNFTRKVNDGSVKSRSL
jgi:hypothetical protein